MENKKKLGFALSGSFCTFEQVMPVIQKLMEEGYDVTPLMSDYARATDTRFGNADDFAQQLESLTGHQLISSIVDAEPVGPRRMFDVMVIAPCTGNTLAKLALGITDTSITMAAKSHLRNQQPLLLAVSTNDALGNSAKNIGALLNYRNVYFVPMKQDNPLAKPRSVVADFDSIPVAVGYALAGKQMQPIYL